MMCDSSSFAVDLLNELARAFTAAADTRSQVILSVLVRSFFTPIFPPLKSCIFSSKFRTVQHMLSRKYYKYTNVQVKVVQGTWITPLTCYIPLTFYLNFKIFFLYYLPSYLFLVILLNVVYILVRDIKFGKSFQII